MYVLGLRISVCYQKVKAFRKKLWFVAEHGLILIRSMKFEMSKFAMFGLHVFRWLI